MARCSFFTLLLLILSAFNTTIYALENQTPSTNAATGSENTRENSEFRRPGERGMGGPGFENFRKVQEEIKSKLPKDYEEYEKLLSVDRRAARSKLRELAAKAGVELPMMGRNNPRRPGNDAADLSNPLTSAEWQKVVELYKTKNPAEFAEIEKLLKTDFAAALQKIRDFAQKEGITLPEVAPNVIQRQLMPRRNNNRLYIKRANFLLKQRDPEAYAELEKLRSEDEDAAREKFRKMVKEAGITLEQLKRVNLNDDNVTVINQPENLTNSTEVSSGNRFSGRGWNGNRFNRSDGGMPPPPPGR